MTNYPNQPIERQHHQRPWVRLPRRGALPWVCPPLHGVFLALLGVWVLLARRGSPNIKVLPCHHHRHLDVEVPAVQPQNLDHDIYLCIWNFVETFSLRLALIRRMMEMHSYVDADAERTLEILKRALDTCTGSLR